MHTTRDRPEGERRPEERKTRATTALLAVLVVLSAGCAGNKEKTRVYERGWVGGEYKQAHVPKLFSPSDTINAFPEPLQNRQKSGLLVLSLSTNTPARLAGLREGDLVVALDHKPVKGLRDFRRVIERTEPGVYLPFTVYRNGEFVVRNIRVGRETFLKQGTLGLGLITYDLNLGINPGFSLFVLGYQPNPGRRTELGSVEQTFARCCNRGSYQLTERDWTAWALVVEVSRGKLILSQEPSPASTSPKFLEAHLTNAQGAAADLWAEDFVARRSQPACGDAPSSGLVPGPNLSPLQPCPFMRRLL